MVSAATGDSRSILEVRSDEGGTSPTSFNLSIDPGEEILSTVTVRYHKQIGDFLLLDSSSGNAIRTIRVIGLTSDRSFGILLEVGLSGVEAVEAVPLTGREHPAVIIWRRDAVVVGYVAQVYELKARGAFELTSTREVAAPGVLAIKE